MGMEKKVSLNSIKDLSKSFVDLNDSAKKATKGLNSFTNSLGRLFSIEKITKGIVNGIKKAVDYTEDLNLLSVAFGDTADEAYKLTKNLSDITGFDSATLNRNLATFRNLASTLGLANEQADLLATNLEKMSLDVSSLYNVDLNEASSALQGMLTGNPRSIKRITGANVTNSALQEELTSRGINLKVSELNRAEKAIVQYLTVEKQLINSNGDLARTLEEPAQLLRVFREQLSMAGRSIGTLFIPLLKAVLPYLNAILMVFNEIVNVFARFFHIDMDSYWNKLKKNTGGVNTNLNNISKSAKQANKGLRAFDKLNVINSSSSSGVGDIGGGINGALLDAVNEYDLKLKDIQTKASKIKDSIMEWLGFTKHVNKETGEVYYTLNEGFTRIKAIGAILAGSLILGTLIKIAKIVYNLSTAEGIFAKIVSGFGAAKTATEAAGTAAGASLGTILAVVGAIAALAGTIIYAYKTDEQFKKSIKDVGEAFVDLFKTISDFKIIKSLVKYIKISAIPTFKNLYVMTKSIIKISFDNLTTSLKMFSKLLKGDFKGALKEAGNGIKKLITNVGNGVEKIIENTKDVIDAATGVKEAKDKFRQIEKIYENASKKISTIKLTPDITINDKFVNETSKNLSKLIDTIKSKATSAKEETSKSLNKLLSQGLLTPEEAEKSLNKINDYYNNIESKVSEAEKNINKILEEAKKNNGKISDEQRKELLSNWEIIQKGTVESLTTSKQEQAIIMKQIQQTNGKISKEAASELIKNALKVRDDTIDAAKKQYTDTLREAQKMYDIGAISKEQYDKICEDAKTTRDDTIKKAQEQYNGVYNEFASMNSDIASYIDRDDGHVKSSWEKFLSDFKTKASDIWDSISNGWNKIKTAWNNLKSWWNDNVGKYFTKDYWAKKIENATKNIHISTPHIKWEKGEEATGWISKTLKAIGLDARLPKLKIDWYANGGFPEDGLFFANHNEMVGKFTNGKTAVANNDQIVEGITKGVTNAILSTGGLNNRPIVIKADGDANGLLSFIKFKQQEENMQFGE